jgi:hypothetical protein
LLGTGTYVSKKIVHINVFYNGLIGRAGKFGQGFLESFSTDNLLNSVPVNSTQAKVNLPK